MSSDEHASLTDDEKQNLCRDFAARHNLVIVGFFAIAHDAARQVSHAVRYCLQSAIDALIIDEPETIALAQNHLRKIIEDLVAANVELGFISHDLMVPSATINVFFRLLIASNKADRIERSTIIKKSLLKKKQRGIPLGGRKFGAVEQESAIVRQILKLHAEGLSLQKICDLLAHHDIKTIHNKKWYPTTVKRIIERAQKAHQKPSPKKR